MIARNSLRDTEGDAILVGCPPCGGLVGTVVRRNHIRGAGEDGVHIGDKARRTRLRRNLAIGAKATASTPMTDDEAHPQPARRNGDLGIEAVRGVIDGGGNRASGNGDPRQCVNVRCH